MTQRLLLILALLCATSSSVLAESTKIVAVLPLSGRLANMGADLRNAISLQDTSAVVIAFEDDSFDAKNTVAAVEKSLLDPSVKGFIFFGSGTALAAKPVIERAKIPGIAVAMSEKIVENSRYAFRYYLSTLTQAERIAKEIQRRGYKNVAFVVSQQEAMLGFEHYFKTKLPFSHDRYFEVQPGDTDLKTTALKVNALKPDAICLLLLPPELPAFAKQARTLGYKGDFFGPTQLGNPDAVKAAAPAMEGTWFTAIDDSLAGKMVEEFRRRYGSTPTSEAIAAFDAAGLLAKAIQSQNALDHLGTQPNYVGLFGSHLRFTHPNTFEPPLGLRRVNGAVFELEKHAD